MENTTNNAAAGASPVQRPTDADIAGECQQATDLQCASPVEPSQAEDNQPAINGPFARTGELAKQFGATETEAGQIQTRVDFLAGGLQSVTQHDKQCLAEFSSFLRMDGEASKLADILSGMTEGGGHYDHPSELYAPDFNPSDGDVYVVRAADLLREQSAEIARLLDLSMKVAQPSQASLGCTYCNNPLFAGTKCKNCGRATQPSQARELSDEELPTLPEFDIYTIDSYTEEETEGYSADAMRNHARAIIAAINAKRR